MAEVTAMAFNLGDMLRQVSEPDTGMEQIEYIPLDLIDEDPNNFYQLTDIEMLADTISLCGLQQPIRVRPQEGGRYMIVSGHRRRAALAMLVADGYDAFSKAACIVERDEVSPALQQLRLIYANASTRKLTSAEIGEQAVQVEKLLYQLKEDGYEFPGRMRDHVAEAVNVSKTKLARLKVIREHLAHCWWDAWNRNLMGESVAYALAQQPLEYQQTIFNAHGSKPNMVYEGSVKEFVSRFEKIDAIKCPHQFCTACDNREAMMKVSVRDRWSESCRAGCCYGCPSLTSCKSACAHCLDHKAELKQTAKAAAQASQKAQEERDAPTLELIRNVYSRVGQMRQERNVSVKEFTEAQGRIYGVTDDDKQVSLEDGSAKISTNTTLPFGYGFYPSQARTLVQAADALGCSIDYLLGRTDCPEVATAEQPTNAPEPGTGWRTGKPEAVGTYVLILCRSKWTGPKAEIWTWDGSCFWDLGQEYDEYLDGKILGWMPMLDTAEAQYD
jgi:ParB family chromosome partitioning protein